MEIERTSKGGIPVISVRGRVQMTDTDSFEEVIRKTENDVPRFIIDLSDASYICSMALGVLIASRRRLMRKGGEIRIVVKSGDVLDVLRLTMIDKVILVEATIEKALASFLNHLRGIQGDGSKDASS